MPKKVPADYTDAMQTDSDFNNDSEYLQGDENELPEVTGEANNAYRLRRRENKKKGRQESYDDANNALNAKRKRSTSPTRYEDDDADDDDEITRPPNRQLKKKIQT